MQRVRYFQSPYGRQSPSDLQTKGNGEEKRYWKEDLRFIPKDSVSEDPFKVILEFQLAWVLDFCLWPKKWETQNFFEIWPHLPTAPGLFWNAPPKIY